MPKKVGGLEQFPDLRGGGWEERGGGWQERGGGVFEREGVDTLMHTRGYGHI